MPHVIVKLCPANQNGKRLVSLMQSPKMLWTSCVTDKNPSRWPWKK